MRYSYNPTIFTNVQKYTELNKKITYSGILVASKLNQKNGQDYSLLDSVDIDWNGAWIESMATYLDTTEDLIRVLDRLNKDNELSDLTYALDQLEEQMHQVTYSYITYTSLGDIIEREIQRKLTAGENIIIDDLSYFDTTTQQYSYSYVISTYGVPTYTYLHDYYWSEEQQHDWEIRFKSQYYTKTQTDDQISDAMAYNFAYLIETIVDGADTRFDTLKEIADWILDLDRYEPVDWVEVRDFFEQGRYYYKETTDPNEPYKEVPNAEFAEQHKDYIYYRKDNWFTDISDLLKRVTVIEGQIGYIEYDDEGNVIDHDDDGILWQLYQIWQESYALWDYSFNLNKQVQDAKSMAEQAIDTANTAYGKAEEALSTASEALDRSTYAIDLAITTYSMAYTAIEKVGEHTIEEGFYPCKDAEDAKERWDNGETIYVKNDKGSFEEAKPPFDDDKEYFYFQDYTPGTGLTGEVEELTKEVEEAVDMAEKAKEAANRSLYNLSVNNDLSQFVTLSLSPENYEPGKDPKRTLFIDAQIALLDPKTGMRLNEGLATLDTCFDVYSYASSWYILGLSDEEDQFFEY